MKKAFTLIAAALVSISAFAQSDFADRMKDGEPLYSNDVFSFDVIGQLGFGNNHIISDNLAIDMNPAKSVEFYMNLLTLDINLVNSGNVQLHTALRWSFDNYVSKDNHIFKSSLIPGTITAIPSTDGVKKSKMRADYIGVPVGIKFGAGKFKIFANAIGEYNTKAITKVKYKGEDNTKENLEGFETFRGSVEAGAAWGKTAIFAKYTLTPTFVKTAFVDSDAHIFTTGIILGF